MSSNEEGYFFQTKTITRSINYNNFRYGHFTKSCLEIFEKIPVLEPIESSHIKVYPGTSLDESSIKFEFETDQSIYLDMRDIHLQIKHGLQNGRLFDDFMKKEEHGKPDMAMTFNDVDLKYLTHINNLLRFLFSNCEVYLNNQEMYNSNGLYAHKALISNELNASTMNNEGILAFQGYEFEKDPIDYGKRPFKDREEELLLKDAVSLYGKLANDLFQCEKLLLPNTKNRLKLIRVRPNFYMISYNPHVSLRVLDCSFFTRRVVVNEVYHQTIKYQLTHQPGCYKIMKTIARTFIIPSGQNQFIQKNVFNNTPIRRIAIAMNTNSPFTGNFQEKPFHYQKFGLREL